MDKLARYQVLCSGLARIVLSGDGQPREDVNLSEFCRLSLELYEAKRLSASELSWANLIARRYYLMPEAGYDNNNAAVQVFDTQELCAA